MREKRESITDEDVMKVLDIKPGPKIGQILAILLDEVLDDPGLNTKKYHIEKIKELGKLSEKELVQLKKKAAAKQKQFDNAVSEDIKKKYYVK